MAKARSVYGRHGLLGSPEKDIEASDDFKAAGAEVKSSDAAVRRGIVPVAAPWSKRLALAVLSLRVARLPAVSSRAVSRLAGSWVSVLMYRRCMTSIVDGLFPTCLQG